jgi:hypothetical protein
MNSIPLPRISTNGAPARKDKPARSGKQRHKAMVPEVPEI